MENMNNEIIETAEIEVAQEVAYEESESKGIGFGPVVALIAVGGAAIGLGKLAWDKSKTWREERTLAKAEKIMAKRAAEEAAEFGDVKVVTTEETEE